MDFKERLSSVMADRNMTASGLSKATGIGKSSISQYLSGRNTPTDKRIDLIAKALECNRSDLVGETPATTRNMPVKRASKLLGVSCAFVYAGLRNGAFPWGYAVKTSSTWSYYISSMKFTECTECTECTGIKVQLEMEV